MKRAVQAGPGDFVAGHRAVYVAGGGLPALSGRIVEARPSGKTVVFAPDPILRVIGGLPKRATFTYRAGKGWFQKGSRPGRTERGLYILRETSTRRVGVRRRP